MKRPTHENDGRLLARTTHAAALYHRTPDSSVAPSVLVIGAYAVLLASITACLSEPSGPFGYQLAIAPNSLTFDALGDTVRLATTEIGPDGALRSTPTIEYRTTDPAVTEVDQAGLVTSRGNGAAWILAQTRSGVIDSIPVLVLQQPSGMVAVGDTIGFESLGAVRSLEANVVDRLGSAIHGAPLEFGVTDSSIARVSPDGYVEARGNGVTTVTVTGAGESLGVVIQVQQRPVRVLTGSDSLRFVALGETGTVIGIAVDSLGHAVPGGVTALAVDDTAVLDLVDSVTVRSRDNGQTKLRFSVAGLAVEQVVVVQQVPDSIDVSWTDSQPIHSQWQDSLLPISCQVLDRNGRLVSMQAEAAPSAANHWSGTTCDTLRIQRSGFDTLVVRAGSVTTVLPVVLAVRPVVSAPLGEYLAIDSFPKGAGPWAPTLVRSPSGDLELYVTGYMSDTSDPNHARGHLHRLLSRDGGRTFQYDSIAVARDDSLCTLNGSGVENVAIVPRSDGSGWRMYYAAGSFGCYGWQVFSAVSVDRQSWIKEAGVRLSNGGTLPPDAPVTPPWPVGEGMVVEPLEGFGWRMLVGGYRHLETAEDKFHIIEWRSTDQLTWTYVGPVLTTDDLPPTGQRSVYSPTIREFSPGLWRMIMTADNLSDPGGRSRLWSAVSTDKTHWVLEGELIGAEGTNLYYSTLVDDLLVFLRADVGQPRRLASVTVAMP
jgi:hypothetical protein